VYSTYLFSARYEIWTTDYAKSRCCYVNRATLAETIARVLATAKLSCFRLNILTECVLHTPNFVFYILVVGCLYLTNFAGTLLCGLYCRRVLACPSVRPSVCRLVKTAERIVEFLLLPGNPVIVVSFRTIPLAGIPVGIIHHHHEHAPSWTVAVSTTCFQCSRS